MDKTQLLVSKKRLLNVLQESQILCLNEFLNIN